MRAESDRGTTRANGKLLPEASPPSASSSQILAGDHRTALRVPLHPSLLTSLECDERVSHPDASGPSVEHLGVTPGRPMADRAGQGDRPDDSLDLSNHCWELAGYGCHRRASESAPLPTAGLVERRRLLSQLHRCVENRGSSTAWLCRPLPWVTPFRHPRAGGSSRWHHGKTVKDLPANRHNRPRCITTYLVGASELTQHGSPAPTLTRRTR